jgi:integrase
MAEAERFAATHDLSKERTNPVPLETNLDTQISTYVNVTLGGKRELTRKNVYSILTQTLPNVNWREPSKIDFLKYLVGKRYRSSTAKGHIKWVKSFIAFNEIDDSKMDWKGLKRALSKEDKKDKHYLTEEDFSKLIAFVPAKYSIIFRYMAACGIRVRELTRLDKADYNPASWKVTLPAKKAKAKKERTFIIPEALREDFVKHVNPSSDPQAPLFHYSGKRIDANGLATRFKILCGQAGIGVRNIHLLRAFAILVILKHSGNDYELVRNIAGWDSAEMQRYLGGMDNAKSELASNLSFTDSQIDTSVEIDRLITSISRISEDTDLKTIAVKSGVPYSWVFNFMTNKRSADIENLLRILKHLGHKVELYGDAKVLVKPKKK